MESDNEFNIVSYLANPIVRSSVKNVAMKYEPTSPLCKLIKEYYISLADGYIPDDGSLIAYLQSKNFTGLEITNAINRKTTYGKVAEDGCNSLITAFLSYYKGSEILKFVNAFYKDKEVDSDKAKTTLIDNISELGGLSGSVFHLDNLATANIDEILDQEVGDESAKIKTSFGVVEHSSAYKTYLKGWIVQICAPPGVGKTLFMMNEIVCILRQGKKVIWVALGDMIKSDFIIRMTAIITGNTLNDVTLNPKKYYSDEVKRLLSGLRVNIQPAGLMTVTETVNNILAIDPEEFNYEVVVIDYDDNFKEEHEMMYKEGGNTYRELTRLAKKKDDYKLVFAASQVKQALWELEILPENCCASSSAKQAVIDMQINIGRHPTKATVGTLNIAKQRRGVVAMAKYKKGMDGVFTEISRPEYEGIIGGMN